LATFNYTEPSPRCLQTAISSETKMHRFLNVILVVVTFFACYIEAIYLSFLPPQPGEVAPFTVRSQRVFNFDQEKALGNYRKVALLRYVPLYDYDSDRTKEARQKLESLSLMASNYQDLNQTDEEALVKYLQGEFGLELDQDTALKLFRQPNLKNIIDGLITIQDSMFHAKIVEDPEPLKGKKSIEVRYPQPTGIVAYPAKEIIGLEKARLILQEKVNQLFWQVDRSVLDTLAQISLATLMPNLKYDLMENERRIEEIIQRYPSKVITYKTGDILVASREVLAEEDVLLLRAYLKEQRKDLYGNAPWILIAIIFIVGFYNLFLSKLLGVGWRKKPPFRLLLSLLITNLIMFKAILLFTPFPLFVVPFASLPLLLILLHNERVSITCTTVTGAMLVCLFSGGTLEIFLFFTFGGVTAVMFSLQIRKRAHIMLPALVVGIINAVTVMAFSLDWESVAGLFLDWQRIDIFALSEVFGANSLEYMAWAFMGGIAAGPLSILLLPLLEVSLNAASNFRLNKYADLQHPLMRDLLSKAPATYQHTMTVAYLAQAVGESLGANTLLLRVGAYYHDIGKMTNPQFFSENQSGGKNPHDTLDPRQSAKLIIDHVRYGETLGRQMGLPQVVLDFIEQHHGTQLVEYFYDKAAKVSHGSEPRKEAFRYRGPKPQSVEAAILMIVDAVEAASRSMEEASRKKIEQMIRLLVVKRIADGQFDECNLSTPQLARTIETLVDSLEASLHSRTEYPWQKKKQHKGRKGVEGKIGSSSIPNG